MTTYRQIYEFYWLVSIIVSIMDILKNSKILAYLESDAGKKAITALHVDGVIDFVEKRKREPL